MEIDLDNDSDYATPPEDDLVLEHLARSQRRRETEGRMEMGVDPEVLDAAMGRRFFDTTGTAASMSEAHVYVVGGYPRGHNSGGTSNGANDYPAIIDGGATQTDEQEVGGLEDLPGAVEEEG